MSQYTVHERCWIIQKYFQTYGTGRGGGYSLNDALADFVQHFRKPLTKMAVLAMVKKQSEYGTVHNMSANHSGRPRAVRTNTNHGIVMESILRSPKKSTGRLSYELKISNTTVRRIIDDLGAHSYKIHVLHTLQPTDLEARKVYCSTMLAQAFFWLTLYIVY